MNIETSYLCILRKIVDLVIARTKLSEKFGLTNPQNDTGLHFHSRLVYSLCYYTIQQATKRTL